MKPSKKIAPRLLSGATFLFLLMAPAIPAAEGESPVEKQRRLIAVLQSDAPPQDKAIPCKQLAIYGNKDAVPALAPLLADKDLASWARIALEAIPGPEADEALRSAVPKLKGNLLIGTINSIGVRRDSKAVQSLAGKLNDADSEVVAAAAAALGKIGGTESAKILHQALSDARKATLSAIAEGSPNLGSFLVEVERVLLQDFDRREFEHRLVRRGEHQLRRLAGLVRFDPSGGAQTPAVAGFESRKVEFRSWRRQIVAARLAELEELGGQADAGRMNTQVVCADIAAAVAIKAGDGHVAAGREQSPQHVAGDVVGIAFHGQGGGEWAVAHYGARGNCQRSGLGGRTETGYNSPSSRP